MTFPDLLMIVTVSVSCILNNAVRASRGGVSGQNGMIRYELKQRNKSYELVYSLISCAAPEIEYGSGVAAGKVQ